MIYIVKQAYITFATLFANALLWPTYTIFCCNGIRISCWSYLIHHQSVWYSALKIYGPVTSLNDYHMRISSAIFIAIACIPACRAVMKVIDTVAERSKALRLGRSPQGRRFEPCRYHFFFVKWGWQILAVDFSIVKRHNVHNLLQISNIWCHVESFVSYLMTSLCWCK